MVGTTVFRIWIHRVYHGHFAQSSVSAAMSVPMEVSISIGIKIVTQVENGKQEVDYDQPKQISISNPTVQSTGEELSDSEDELLEGLEGVVSSKQDVEALNQPKAAVSLVKAQSKLKNSSTLESPDLLDRGVKGVAAELNSYGGIVFNKYLSKSNKRCLQKQAKEESISSFSNGRN
ncbi:hypothetical protein RHSIM_Rhsim12G0100400 [Rhododendron simsii]|uniref:Uncharacterized protein n=1 Tax=Rhododendron simsii TaxID=118357 RepID=A0A834L5L0_RHOSS|nr:hypothetical protein RHSIM_Rhsim12G0100400 [Rhododendron simsii]